MSDGVAHCISAPAEGQATPEERSVRRPAARATELGSSSSGVLASYIDVANQRNVTKQLTHDDEHVSTPSRSEASTSPTRRWHSSSEYPGWQV